MPSAPRASGGATSATGSMKIPSVRACRGEAARRTFSQTSFLRLRSPRRARAVDKKSDLVGSAGAAAGLGDREGTFGPRAAPVPMPPRHLPRLSLKDGVPPEGKTVCVLSVLLTGEKAANGALRRLEEFRAASRGCGENLLFGLLCDLPESGETLSHADRVLLDHAAAKTDALNVVAARGLLSFHPDRLYSRDSGKFAPWERKRGALLELCRLLAGENTTLRVRAGDAEKLRSTRYILTLDAEPERAPENHRHGAPTRSTARRSIPNAGSFFAATACCIAHRRIKTQYRGTTSRTLCLRPAAIPTARTPGRCIWTHSKAAASRGRGSSMWGRISRVWGNAFPKGAY